MNTKYFVSKKEFIKLIDVKECIELKSNRYEDIYTAINECLNTTVTIYEYKDSDSVRTLIPSDEVNTLKSNKLYIYECDGNIVKGNITSKSRNILEYLSSLGEVNYINLNKIKLDIVKTLRESDKSIKLDDVKLSNLNDIWISESTSEGFNVRSIAESIYTFLTEAPGDDPNKKDVKKEESKTKPEDDEAEKEPKAETDKTQDPPASPAEENDPALDAEDPPEGDLDEPSLDDMDNDDSNNISDDNGEEFGDTSSDSDPSQRTDDKISKYTMILLLKKYQSTYEDIDSALKNLRQINFSDNNIDFEALNRYIATMESIRDGIYEYIKYRFKGNSYFDNRAFLAKLHEYIKICTGGIEDILGTADKS